MHALRRGIQPQVFTALKYKALEIFWGGRGEQGFGYVAQTGLQLIILLLLSSKSWDYSHEPSPSLKWL